MKNFFLSIILISVSAASQTAEPVRYTKVSQGYLMVLRQGDDIFKQLEAFAKAENIPSANFTGMGFASSVTFGFFNFQTKKYEQQEFQKVEIATLAAALQKKEALILFMRMASLQGAISTHTAAICSREASERVRSKL